MDRPPVAKGNTLPDEPVLGIPSPLQEQAPLVGKQLRNKVSDEPEPCGPWASRAAMWGFAAFALFVVGVMPLLSQMTGKSDASPAPISDPWSGAADMLPGNETRFSDPAWQKQQALQLLSAWGFASGQRSFVAMAGTFRTCCVVRSHCSGFTPALKHFATSGQGASTALYTNSIIPALWSAYWRRRNAGQANSCCQWSA